MGPIDILDDFLDKDLYDKVLDIIDKTPMFYGSKSNVSKDQFAHWMSSLTGTDRFNRKDCSDRLHYSLYDVWKPVRAVLKNKVLTTAYVNGHTYGVEGYFHTDTEENNCTTAILYLVRGEWDPNWAGETVFIDDKNEIRASVLPRANRLVVFPGNINHCARGVTRACPVLRKTMIFKTRQDSA